MNNSPTLNNFFQEIPTKEYLRVLQAAAKGVGSGFNEAGVTFPGDQEPGDVVLKDDEVEMARLLGK